jgi:hypothetical protein
VQTADQLFAKEEIPRFKDKDVSPDGGSFAQPDLFSFVLTFGHLQELFATMPPYEIFLPLNKARRTAHFFRCVQAGELLICSIAAKMPNGLSLKLLCADSNTQRYVGDLSIRVSC